jgi:hypothetical protein
VVKSFAKCLAHDGTLEMCVPLVPQRHNLLSHDLNLHKFSLYSMFNENSNTMTSKLRDVCRTQWYDPPCGLEVI